MPTANVMYANSQLKRAMIASGERGHGHAAEVVAGNDDAGHSSHRVREPESDHLAGGQYGCAGEACIDECG